MVAGFAVARFETGSRRATTLFLAAIWLGLVIDAAPRPLPLIHAPSWRSLGVALHADQAVLELPLGEITDDVLAMYRGMEHGQPVVNGYSGFYPSHYAALRYALEARDPGALSMLAEHRALAILIHGRAESVDRSFLREAGGVVVADHRAALVARMDHRPATSPPVLGARLRIGRITAMRSGVSAESNGNTNLVALNDDAIGTRWTTERPQRAGDRIVIDLREQQSVAAVVLALGLYTSDFPRRLRIEGSGDGNAWEPLWEGPTAVATIRAALAEPARVPLTLAFPCRWARFLRLTELADDPVYYWSISDIAVHSSFDPSSCPGLPPATPRQ
jgi:hypothetical protein